MQEPEKIEKGLPKKVERKKTEREDERLREIEGKWEKEAKIEEKEIEVELGKARRKIEEITEKKRKEEEEKKEKEKVFERIKEVVGIPSEDLIRYDDIILDDSKAAWKFREEKLKEGRKEVMATVAGIKSKRAREILGKKLGKKEKQKYWREINGGLMFNDSEWADEIREWLRFDEEVGRIRAGRNAKIWKALGLNKSEGWFERRKAFDKFSSSLFSLFRMDRVLPAGFDLPGDLLLSTIGVPAENETKKRLLEQFGNDFPAEAILSFLGDSSDEAQEMVKKYYQRDEKLRWAYQRWQKSLEKEK